MHGDRHTHSINKDTQELSNCIVSMEDSYLVLYHYLMLTDLLRRKSSTPSYTAISPRASGDVVRQLIALPLNNDFQNSLYAKYLFPTYLMMPPFAFPVESPTFSKIPILICLAFKTRQINTTIMHLPLSPESICLPNAH